MARDSSFQQNSAIPLRNRPLSLQEEATSTLTEPGFASTPSFSSTPVSEDTPAEETMESNAPSPVEDFIGHYEVIRPLGAGGMGSVLLARDTKLGRLAAIKLLHHSGEAASRLLAEARATVRARHENIVIIYEVGTIAGRPYMVLEYLEGRTLREVISAGRSGRGRPISRGFALEVMVPVIEALEAAHQSGIIHRDLKPENIMLLDSGQVKVLDFGIAKAMDSQAPHGRMGTRPYMSPEQWLGAELDARSDLWAAGIILYELLAGAHPLAPFSAQSLESIGNLDEPLSALRKVKPELASLSEVIAKCTSKRKEERYRSAKDLLAALEPFLARPRLVKAGEITHPFAGLAAFQETDGDRFYGRERDVMAVLGLLDRQPLVTIAGASGAGKSSFLRAGLIPALKTNGEDWHVLVVRPGRTPLMALQEALEVPEGTWDLRAQPLKFGAHLRSRCRMQGKTQRYLVFVDQMEELYTLVGDPEERKAFLDCLLGAADDAYSPVRVVLSIRSDFLDRVIADHLFMVHVAAGLFFLPPMDEAGQRKALTNPVEAAGYQFESEKLVSQILEELSRTNNPLPLLQFTATKLWEDRDSERKLLTQAAYDQMGGVAGALAKHADTVVLGLSTSAQRVCRAILLRLITPERTRAVVYLRELSTLDEDSAAVQSIVHQLAAARLITVDADAVHGDAKVEIVHESLISRWPMLSQWLDESAGNAHFLARLRVAALQWETNGKPTGMLWRDRAAEEARSFYERYGRNGSELRAAFVGTIEAEYLQAVMALSDHSRRTRNLLVISAFLVVSAIAVVVLFLALDARLQARRADEEAANVRKQNIELAVQALRGRNATRILAARKNQDDPTTALSILREVERPDLPKDWPELVSAALSTGVAQNVWRTDPARCGYAVVASPDGKQIAVAMDDQTTRILDAQLVEKAVLRGHTKVVWSVDWSPDGKKVVSASFDHTAQIALADGTGQPMVLRGHTDALNAAEFSPDGQRIITGADDKTARIWNVADGREVAVFRQESEPQDASWSPDGQKIVTTGVDGLIRIWQVNSQEKPLVLRGHGGVVAAAKFSPDGSRIASVGRDRTLRIWDARTGTELLVLQGHEEKILQVAWSPDGQRIATASKDKTARIWNADGRGAPIVLRGHNHWVYTATWSPDGRQIFTTSLDGTQRRFVLDDIVHPILLKGHEDAIRSMMFSPDGRRIATGSMDGTTRIWNADGTGEVIVLRDGVGATTYLQWSPNGKQIVTISDDKSARVWNMNDVNHPVVMTSDVGVFQAVEWSHNGEWFATASAQGKITLWSKDGVERASVTKETTSEFKWVRCYFDVSDKRILIMDSTDPKVYLWNVDSTERLEPITVMTGKVLAAKWSREGTHFLAIAANGKARLVNAQEPEKITELNAANPIRNGTWSPRGQFFLALSDGSLLPHANGSFGTSIASGVPEEGTSQFHFSPDGEHILTFTPYGHVRVRNANGQGAPFVLGGTSLAAGQAHYSSTGERIAVMHEDKFAWIWPNVRPFSGTDDERLWRLTSHCLSKDKRMELLGSTEEQAMADEKTCHERVAAVRSFK